MLNIKSIKRWHLLLIWPAFIASFIYVVSAFTHPLMAWTGPQAKVMFPPSLTLEAQQLSNIEKIITKNNLTQAHMVKLVPSESQPLLQITHSKQAERRYFSLSDFTEIKHQDTNQALWLAEHYLKEKYPIKSIELKTDFDASYPAVNRLLPVYKINFDTQDNLSVYIHTDTQALAGIENDWKRSLRFVFQTFHTLNWLDDTEGLRLFIKTLLLICLIGMSITGILFLIKLKRVKSVPDTKRRWHRRLAWFTALPLLFYSISGAYHLWQSSLNDAPKGMQLTQTLNLLNWPTNESLSIDGQLHINQVSLLQIPNLQSEIPNEMTSIYRISVSQIQSNTERTHDINTREKRFHGQSKEKSTIYINAQTGESLGDLDTQLVQQQAIALFNQNHATELPMKLITHFGLGYDFRNKRLPVWRVENTDGQQVFIDPISHILVDRNTSLTRLEGYSFSFLHKWNMLNPVMGRKNRDIVIMITLGTIFALSLLGIILYLSPSKQKLLKPDDQSESQKQAA